MLPIIAAIAGAGYLIKKGVDLLDEEYSNTANKDGQKEADRQLNLLLDAMNDSSSRSYVEDVPVWEEPGPLDSVGRAAGKSGEFRHYFKLGRKPDGTPQWKRRVLR